jgi:nucleoside-diphosphate-sugar epimerase
MEEIKKVLITGASGYIGKGVLKEFIKNKWKVVALVREESKGLALQSLGADYVIGDLGNQSLLQTLADGADTIIHCAREHGTTSEANKKDLLCIETFINVGNRNAETKPCSFIYTSGCLCLGEGDDVKDETSKISEPTSFGKWRYEHEEIILSKIKENHKNFKTIIVRPSWVYGNNEGYITDYLNHCKESSKAYIINKGLAFCNFIHIDDLSNLYFLLAISKEEGVFHATDNIYLNYIQVAEELRKKYNYEIVETSLEEGYKLFGLSAYSQVINQKMTTIRSLSLGWTPKHSSFLNYI